MAHVYEGTGMWVAEAEGAAAAPEYYDNVKLTRRRLASGDEIAFEFGLPGTSRFEGRFREDARNVFTGTLRGTGPGWPAATETRMPALSWAEHANGQVVLYTTGGAAGARSTLLLILDEQQDDSDRQPD